MRASGAVAAAAFLVPALVSAQPFTFVSTPASDALAVIDLEGNTLAGTVPLSGLPTGCAVGPHGSRLYAALTQSDTLAMIDMESGALSLIPVGAGPSGVAVGGSGQRVYVANSGADTVSVVDPVAGEEVATIPVGDGPLHLVASGRRLYVANWGGRTVSVIDTAQDVVLANVPVGRFPAGLAVDRVTRRLYVANSFDDTVTVVDTATLSVLSTIPVARSPHGLALDAAGKRLFVASFDDARVQIVDTSTGTVILEAGSGGRNPMDLMLGPDGTRLYVAHLQEAPAVAVLDAATLAPVASVNVPAGPVAFAGVSPRSPSASPPASWTSAARAAFGGWRTPRRPARPPVREPDGADVVISDTEFNVGDWTVTGGGTQATTHEPTGGNPGAWRLTDQFPGPNTVTTHRLVRPGSHYDPAQLGAVDGIDVRWDHRIQLGSVVLESFCAHQGGVAYCTFERFFTTTQWTGVSEAGLDANDFSDATGAHPDFSNLGTAITFGYRRRSGAEERAAHGIDNFVVTVHTGAVNAPGQLGFKTTTGIMGQDEVLTVLLQRAGGTLGAVGTDVRIERPDGTVAVQTVSWSHGDGSPATILLSFPQLPSDTAASARLTLSNPTGGATVDPARDAMSISVYPVLWPSALIALVGSLVLLLAGMSPAWLLVLAVPVVLSARR
jgi:YVTN family beta-propeller protein